MQAQSCPPGTFFLLPGRFSGSTAPQAFSRPDRKMLTPARAGAVKAGRFFSGHRRLGLDSAEHDGTMDRSGPDDFSLPFVSRRSFGSAGYSVLFAVEPSSPHHGLRGIRRRNVPNALTEVSREESRGRRGPSRQGRRFAA